MTEEYDRLARITAALQERAMAEYQEVLTEERQLRREIAEIEQLRRSAMADDCSAHARRISGVDAQWQGWLIQRHMQINQKLALLQVHKAERQDAARLSFGRQDVASRLAADAHRAKATAKLESDENALNALALLHQIQHRTDG